MGGKSQTNVKVFVTETQLPGRSRRKAKVLVVGLLAGTIGLIGVGSGLALQLIINPTSVRWFTQLLPDWIPSFRDPGSQTLAEITAEVERSGQRVGSPIQESSAIGTAARRPDLILPILSPYSCPQSSSAQCWYIRELRLYRSETGVSTWQLLDRLAVDGLEEFVALAPLIEAKIVKRGSSDKLPMTSATVIAGKAPFSGLWLHLSGEWQRGSNHIVYGQVVRYDPQVERLQPLIAWTSPAGQLPHWQTVTGRQPQLVIDQTIGLEPHFQVYQVNTRTVPGQPVQLDAITLTETALANPLYRQGLLLARNGLWSAAQRSLQAAKQRDPAHWSTTAQAQLDVIALHATVTQSQADRDWASPTQQVVTQLMDGRWTKALTLLQTAHRGGYDIPDLLSINGDSLWPRIETALRVQSNQPDVLKWGILLQAIQKNRHQALVWLEQQTGGRSAINSAQMAKVLDLLDPLAATTPPMPTSPTPMVTPVMASSPIAPTTAPIHPLMTFLGLATPIDSLNPADWFSPNPAWMSKKTDQIWYQVTVLTLYDGQQWQRSPFSTIPSATSAPELWSQLGLNPTLTLQLVTPSDTGPQARPATLAAMRLHKGELHLLTLADPSPEPRPSAQLGRSTSLALSSPTLSWLVPTQPSPLLPLLQQAPWMTALQSPLRQELQPSQRLATSNHAFEADQRPSLLTDWTVELVDVTGDGRPEAVLTSPQLHHLIVTEAGTVLYRDRPSTEATSLMGIIRLADQALPVLILHRASDYQLLRWSAAQQQFTAIP